VRDVGLQVTILLVEPPRMLLLLLLLLRRRPTDGMTHCAGGCAF
jgi:hypothetical protein